MRGQTGESVGQRLMGIVTVDEDTGASIGPARSVIRSLAHVLDILPTFAATPVPLPTRAVRPGRTPSAGPLWWRGR
ncbi:RDD family protein [Streptomyces kaniharaensis]|uniref:RDD family protein n=1 Tax=Streptomyces kaniharaensis TaxID=212423 RepID=A0A6N7L608_9ACTN|nr:RDD family protein [Streptomyces kaniharaensis]MQS17914.1 RDD family protein [Streptomyces kaniharaensis]